MTIEEDRAKRAKQEKLFDEVGEAALVALLKFFAGAARIDVARHGDGAITSIRFVTDPPKEE